MKRIMKKMIAAVMVTGALTLSPIAASYDQMPSSFANVVEAKAAPDVDLQDLRNGEMTCIEVLHAGKPLFLNFWASWCPPCVGEMPHIQKMYEKYGDRINIAAVSIDDNEGDAIAYIKEAGLSLPTYYGDVQKIGKAYQIEAIPLSLIVSPSGEIIAEQLGGMSESEMDSFIQSALK